MAASSPSSKASPSEKPLDATDRPAKPDNDTEPTAPSTPESPGQVKAAPEEQDAKQASLSIAMADNVLTYESVESSQRYQVAKTLLQEGEFEDALTTIGEGLEEIKEQLFAAQISPERIDFHPALAPLHYLYGTTLLYSVEESSSDQGLAPIPPSEDGEDPAEDTQIAYENLDIARVIVEQYLESIQSGHKSDEGTASAAAAASTTKSVDALRLDLAQIRLREGDLHRLNGSYEPALQDYQACLEFRNSLGPYDRKLADVHYNLGLTYSLMVASSSSSGGTTAETTSPAAAPVAAAAAAATAPTEEAPTLTPQQLENARCRAAHHYWQCGRILGGQLALMAERNVDEFLAQVQAALPPCKKTGEEEEQVDMESPARARIQLRTLRQHVATLPLDSVHAPEMASLMQVLEEIQETMDESDNAEAGVHQVAQMKSEIAAAAAASGEGASLAAKTAGGETVTADEPPQAAAAFGSRAAAALTATAQPIMAVRKKKRPPQSAAEDSSKASKQPKPSSE